VVSFLGPPIKIAEASAFKTEKQTVEWATINGFEQERSITRLKAGNLKTELEEMKGEGRKIKEKVRDNTSVHHD
jgi:hypothetical protein